MEGFILYYTLYKCMLPIHLKNIILINCGLDLRKNFDCYFDPSSSPYPVIMSGEYHFFSSLKQKITPGVNTTCTLLAEYFVIS